MILNPEVNGLRWNPTQIFEQFKTEDAFVSFWKGDKALYDDITDEAKREATIRLAWTGAMANLEANGLSCEKKK